jgi:hypothetical protein
MGQISSGGTEKISRISSEVANALYVGKEKLGIGNVGGMVCM